MWSIEKEKNCQIITYIDIFKHLGRSNRKYFHRSNFILWSNFEQVEFCTGRILEGRILHGSNYAQVVFVATPRRDDIAP